MGIERTSLESEDYQTQGREESVKGEATDFVAVAPLEQNEAPTVSHAALRSSLSKLVLSMPMATLNFTFHTLLPTLCLIEHAESIPAIFLAARHHPWAQQSFSVCPRCRHVSNQTSFSCPVI
jgi:hypothetical protein